MSGYAAPRSGGLGGILRLVLVLVELFLVAIVLILGAAFVMSFLGANPDASFAHWVYTRADSIMTPFNGIFSPISISDGMQINVSLLFAMAVYGVIASVLEAFGRRL